MPGLLGMILNQAFQKDQQKQQQQMVMEKWNLERPLMEMKLVEAEAELKARKARHKFMQEQAKAFTEVTTPGETGSKTEGMIPPTMPGMESGLTSSGLRPAGAPNIPPENLIQMLLQAHTMFPSPGKESLAGVGPLVTATEKIKSGERLRGLLGGGQPGTQPGTQIGQQPGGVVMGMQPDTMAQLKALGLDVTDIRKLFTPEYKQFDYFDSQSGETRKKWIDTKTGQFLKKPGSNEDLEILAKPAEFQSVTGANLQNVPGISFMRKDQPGQFVSPFIPTGPAPLQTFQVEGPNKEVMAVPVNPYEIQGGIKLKPSPLHTPIDPDDLPKYRNQQGQSPPMGSSPFSATASGFKPVSTKEQEKLFNVNNIETVIGQVRNLGKKLFTEKGLLERGIGSAKATYSVISQNDPDVIKFLSFSQGTIPMLIRAMGEVGNLSETEQKRGLQLIPKIYPIKDTQAVFEAKMKSLEDFFAEIRARASQQKIVTPTAIPPESKGKTYRRTATNPQTGGKVGLTEDGKWEPIK